MVKALLRIIDYYQMISSKCPKVHLIYMCVCVCLYVRLCVYVYVWLSSDLNNVWVTYENLLG